MTTPTAPLHADYIAPLGKEFTMKRPTYDWLLILSDNTFAVAHGRKSWEETEKYVDAEVVHYSRLSPKCKAQPVVNGWQVFKQGVYLGGIRLKDGQWETSNPAGVWASTWGLSTAAKGWSMEYLAVLGAA